MDISNKQDREILQKYIGNTYQIGGTRHYRLDDGKSNGCRCIDVRTGSGLEYTVVCDRGLDISLASFKGINLVHLTENMESNPAFYNPQENEWLRTFSAGLLTTCGPTHLSSPCTDNNESLGLHGRWSSLSAKHLCDLTDFESGKIEISGTLYDCVLFGDKLKINRKIKSEYGKSSIIIEDKIKNEGGKPSPLNILYHCNFGFPLLDESAIVHVPSKSCSGYNEYSQQFVKERSSIKSPDAKNMEKNYLHTFDTQDSCKTVWIYNKNINDGLAVYITFDSKQLPYLTQWVLEDIKDYVLALEPANVPCESRNILRQNNMLPFLQPGESADFRIEIGVIEGKENIEKILGK